MSNNDNFVSIGDLWHLCVARWRWFVISIALCLLLAAYKVVTSDRTYTYSSSIMVLNEEGKNNSSVDNDFSRLGVGGMNVTASNVVSQLTSLEVLMEVAHRMGLGSTEEELLDQALAMRDNLSVETQGLKSSVIDLRYRDTSAEKAKALLSILVQVYNDVCLKDRRINTQNTSSFIDTRLALLETDLDLVDDSISAYKSRNKITDVERVSDVYLQQQTQSGVEIMQLENQKSIAEYILSILQDGKGTFTTLPANSGISNNVLESQIQDYNQQVMQFNSHLDYTSTQNPRILIQERDLNRMRDNIASATQNYINGMNIQLNALRGYNSDATSKIISNPKQAQYLASIEREQKVKEGLYLFLLQKKEENEISSTYRFNSIKTLDTPYLSGTSSSSKSKVLAAAFLLGLLLPITLIFVLSMVDKTVRRRDDVESHPQLSLAGVVPYCGKHLGDTLVVAAGRQDPVNEAFRLLRTPIEQHADDRVYMVTSFGDKEGKTFVATNLAQALAIHEKHVLFIDGDLRRGDASRLWQRQGPGLADYLSGDVDNLPSLICRHSQHPTLDILPAGDLPTNPTELLASQRFQELVASQRQQYDVVLIDTPPCEGLADTDIVAEVVDSTLLVVREHRTERQQLDKLETASAQQKYKHLALVLNASLGRHQAPETHLRELLARPLRALRSLRTPEHKQIN